MSYFDRIKTAFATVIDATEIENMHSRSTMEDVKGWDSTNFIELVLVIEDEFDIEMSTLDAASLTSIPAIERYLQKRLD